MNEAKAKVGRHRTPFAGQGTVTGDQDAHIGGVIQPAAGHIMEMYLFETTLVEAQIRPQDRGFYGHQTTCES